MAEGEGGGEERGTVRTLATPLSRLTRVRRVYRRHKQRPNVLLLSKYIASRGARLVCTLKGNCKRALVILSDRSGTGGLCRRCHFLGRGADCCPTGSLLFCRTSVRKGRLIGRQVRALRVVVRTGDRIAIVAAVSKFVSRLPSRTRVGKSVLAVSGKRTLRFRSLGRGVVGLKCSERTRISNPKRFTIHNKVVSVCPLARRLPVHVRF